MAKTTKKPTAKQIAARKKFAAMAKAKGKAAKSKKPTAKKTAVKKTAAKKITSTYQTGSSNKLYDSRKKAQGPGKRVSVDGNVYYERRKNRSDMQGSLTGIDNKTKFYL